MGPDFVFHVIGANHCPEAIARLNGTMIDGITRIIVHGYGKNRTKSVASACCVVASHHRVFCGTLFLVADLKEFYGRMRVSVVPLRWGAGVKGKVNSAMSHGVPVVCTTVAQEGMHLVDGVNALIADDPKVFAAKVRLFDFPSSSICA